MEGEREGGRERNKRSKIGRVTISETEKLKDSDRHTDIHTADRQRQTDRDTNKERQRQTERQTDRDRKRQGQTETKRQSP